MVWGGGGGGGLVPNKQACGSGMKALASGDDGLVRSCGVYTVLSCQI